MSDTLLVVFPARALERFDGRIGGEEDGHGAVGAEGERGAAEGCGLHGPLSGIGHRDPRREADGHHLPDGVSRQAVQSVQKV